MKSVPTTVWALGTVSLLMDLSSELIHGLLPAFLTVVLGASTLELGLVEGIGEATSQITKLFSGALSDRLGRRKALVLAGYGLSAASKPLFPLASSVGLVLGARFSDRIGKGLRGAPRDALIADVTPPGLRGTAYGLRQAMDTAGAVLGPLAAVFLMLAFSSRIRHVLWAAVVPALAAVLVIALFVREPRERLASSSKASFKNLRAFDARYWGVVALAAVLTLARFSEAFLILRGESLGLALALLPLVLVVMNVVYTAVAYPAGILADRGRRRALLGWGLAALVGADLVMALTASLPALFAGVALWGVHMGLTQGLLSALVADAAPPQLRGSAFGVFYLVSGVVLLAASVLAGWLWQTLGPSFTFGAGALFTAAALAGLLAVTRARRPAPAA